MRDPTSMRPSPDEISKSSGAVASNTTIFTGSPDRPTLSGGTKPSNKPKRRTSPKQVDSEYPERKMTWYQVNNTELRTLGFSGGIGSILVAISLHLFDKFQALSDKDVLYGTIKGTMILTALLALACYVSFVKTVAIIKWKSGKKGWQLFTD